VEISGVRMAIWDSIRGWERIDTSLGVIPLIYEGTERGQIKKTVLGGLALGAPLRKPNPKKTRNPATGFAYQKRNFRTRKTGWVLEGGGKISGENLVLGTTPLDHVGTNERERGGRGKQELGFLTYRLQEGKCAER